MLVAARGIDRCLCGIQRLHAVLQELLASVRQGQMAGTAQQQGHAQFLLQPLQVEADHRTAEAEPIGCCGEAAGLDHGAEDIEAIEADHGNSLSKWIDSVAVLSCFSNKARTACWPLPCWSAADAVPPPAP
ncbi:hypothetical protein VM57_12090 [Stenotrophomonas maltophilia]|uniref:Uncharacterized protein n=1 Tax=Stenotrophomonas maltophilia TaxID=40324 RepID=A0A0F5ZNH1_STEMA|nr:hypothetical protein VM57_12090 [Stenotrophomonas maltophilia]